MMTSSLSPRANRRSRSDAAAASPRGERRGFQIGPRIRIGGSVGKIGQNVKKAVTKGATDAGHMVGKIADNKYAQLAALAALTATGVGAAPAAGIMAAMKGGGALLKPGGNIGAGAKGAVIGAAEGYGASKLGSGIRKLAGIGKAASTAGDAGGDSSLPIGDDGMPTYSPGAEASAGGGVGDESFLGRAEGAVKNVAGKVGGLVKGAASQLGGGNMSALDKLLLAAGMSEAAISAMHKRQLERQGLEYAEGSYSARQPLRHQGLAMLQSQQTPDLSFLDNTANPYTRPVTPFNVSQKTPIMPTGGSY